MTDKNNEKNQLWMGPLVSRYAQTISRLAPDAIVTLGVFLYILAHRAYSGRRYGWTQIPIQYMATKSQMGFTRIRASLNWLIEKKVIEPGLKQKYQARRYKVILPTLEERQAILKSTPKEVEGGPAVEIVFWSPSTATVEWQTVSSEYANSLLKCNRCNSFFDPTLGQHPEEKGRCVACYIKSMVEWNINAHLELDFGSYDWTIKQVNKFLTSFETH